MSSIRAVILFDFILDYYPRIAQRVLMENLLSSKEKIYQQWAWYLFDLGNLAYAAVALLAIYSAYFQTRIMGRTEGTRLGDCSLEAALFVVTLVSLLSVNEVQERLEAITPGPNA
jgi:MFS-type transporter involved in bile tolerance (Atg22 family)